MVDPTGHWPAFLYKNSGNTSGRSRFTGAVRPDPEPTTGSSSGISIGEAVSGSNGSASEEYKPMGNAAASYENGASPPSTVKEQFNNLVYLLQMQWDEGWSKGQIRAEIGSRNNEWCGETAAWCMPSSSGIYVGISAYKNYEPDMGGYYGRERYRSASDHYIPQCGDIMYRLNPAGNLNDGHVTTVIGVINDIVYTIEGNSGGKVRLIGRTFDELAAGYWHYTVHADSTFYQPDITNLIEKYYKP